MNNFSKHIYSVIVLIALTITSVSCDEDDKDPVIVLNATQVNDLSADAEVNPDGSERELTNQYTLFSLENNTVINNTDSATTQWDIGFRGTSIIVNGGESGPGVAGVQIINNVFEEVVKAPEDGYGTTISGSSWYTYTGEAPSGPQHAILATAGKVFVLKTATGKYAKLELISYYQGNPDTSTAEFANLATRPASRYYTFRFVYQPDGSKDLE